jgi:hypothetical protein
MAHKKRSSLLLATDSQYIEAVYLAYLAEYYLVPLPSYPPIH